MLIERATSDAQRAEVQEFFSRQFGDIAPNAVPASKDDEVYAPIIAVARTDAGHLLGAALTCRTQLAAATVVSSGLLGDPFNLGPVLDKHSELDLLAVDPAARGQGIATAILQYLEDALAMRGVRVWFGNVTKSLEVDALRTFYLGRGFTLVPSGQPLPPLLGRQWHLPGTQQQSAFHFWKKLSPAGPRLNGAGALR